MSRTKIDRRQLLRGVLGGGVIALGLPPLEEMLGSHGTAYAAGQPLPRIFGVWFWGGGSGGEGGPSVVNNKWWVPAETGMAWTPTPLLEPLARVKEHVTVVSNTELKHKGNVHHTQRAAALSATYLPNLADLYSPNFGGVEGPSIDQVVAEAWKGQTALPSIEIGISKKGPFLNTTSFRGTKQRLPSEPNPRVVYTRLFANSTGGGTLPNPAALEASLKAQRGVVDAVAADAQSLLASGRLGMGSRRAVQRFLDEMREVEKQLVPPPPITCSGPPAPESQAVGDVNREDLAGRHKIMADLLVLGLACNATRVFSIEFTPMQAYTVYWQIGVTTEHHELTHMGSRKEDLRKTIHFNMQQLAYLVEKLKGTPFGAGSLLDQCCLYATTESANAEMHTSTDHPMLVIGKGGGALKAGQHLKAPRNDSHAKVLLTLCKAMGLPLTEFGKGVGRVTDIYPELLA